MFRTVLSFLTLALVASASPVPSGPLRINAPTLTQCGIATFTWTQTAAPYYFSILRSDETSGTTGFTKDSDTAVIPRRPTASWIVDYPAGTTVRIIIRDSNGDIAGTESLYIGEGNEECMEVEEEDVEGGFVDQTQNDTGREFK